MWVAPATGARIGFPILTGPQGENGTEPPDQTTQSPRIWVAAIPGFSLQRFEVARNALR